MFIKAILSFCLATFLPLHSEFKLLIHDIPVSIPDNAQKVQDCRIGMPDYSGNWHWTSFDGAMNRFYGGQTAQRSLGGNAYLSITINKGCDPYEIDRLRHARNFQKALEVHFTAWQEQQRKIQAERAAALVQQRAQEENTRRYEIACFKTELLKQEALTHQEIQQDLYFIWSNSELESRFHQRAAALKNMLQSPDSVLTKKYYTLSKPVQTIITQYDKQAEYAHLQGSELQHVLHQELLDLYQESAQLPNNAAFYKDQIAQTGALAREANENGSVVLASQILDYGWTLLECGKSVVLGVKDGVVNVAKAIIHPIDTLTDMAHGVLQIAQLSVAGIKEASCFTYDAATNKEQMYVRIDAYRNNIQQFCNTISGIPMQELIRKTTAFLTEAVILHRAFKAFPQLKQCAKQSSQNVVNYIQKTRQTIEQSRTIAATIQGVKLPAAQYLEQMSSEVKLTAEKVYKTSALKTATTFIPFEQELPLLRERFGSGINGWNIFEGEKIKIHLRHIFEDKLILTDGSFDGFSGFHHDSCLIIKTAKKSNGIPFQILQEIPGPAESYKLILQGKDRPIPKSFFPSHWSREKVMEKIIEAYGNAKKVKNEFIPDRKGKYILYGETTEKIKVRMVFNQKFSMISAYPEIN